eukprot:scaffold3076_cov154-Skeletonema_dohrnii-CCMP3373.AAC.2
MGYGARVVLMAIQIVPHQVMYDVVALPYNYTDFLQTCGEEDGQDGVEGVVVVAHIFMCILIACEARRKISKNTATETEQCTMAMLQLILVS